MAESTSGNGVERAQGQVLRNQYTTNKAYEAEFRKASPAYSGYGRPTMACKDSQSTDTLVYRYGSPGYDGGQEPFQVITDPDGVRGQTKRNPDYRDTFGGLTSKGDDVKDPTSK
jgi:hypothetical protein